MGDEEEGGTLMSERGLTRMVRMDGKLDVAIEKLGELADAHEASMAWWGKALTLLMNPSRNFLILFGMIILGGGAISASEFATAMGWGDCECEDVPKASAETPDGS